MSASEQHSTYDRPCPRCRGAAFVFLDRLYSPDRAVLYCRACNATGIRAEASR